MKILIGGGTGFVGRYLRYFLHKGGHEMVVVSRRPGPNTITWSDIERSGLPKGCDAVVNLSGQNLMDVTKRFDDTFKADLRASRINTTLSMVRAISKTDKPPAVWLSTSAIGYYPSSSTEEYTEDSRVRGDTFMCRLCQDWEEAATLPADLPTRSVTVRIGVVLGPDGGVVKSMYLPFFLGVGGPVSTGKQWFPWIHVDDVANIYKYSIENDNVHGILNAVAPESATNATFSKALARAMWRPALFPMPAFVLNWVFGAERAKVMTEGQKVIPKRTQASGYKFIYPDLKSACESALVSKSDLKQSFKWDK